MFGAAPIPDAMLRGGVLSGATLVWIIAIVRMMGVRALSKMTAFDFVVTLATGSLLASAAVAKGWPEFLQALVALTTLFCLQYVLAWVRGASPRFRRFIENQPLIVMRDGRIDEAGLRESRMSRDDVYSKLRQADVGDPGAVAAFVVEATGDISVIADKTVRNDMLSDVRMTPDVEAGQRSL